VIKISQPVAMMWICIPN